MANRSSHLALGATDSAIRPSVYILGSRQSRAAARALLGARRAAEHPSIDLLRPGFALAGVLAPRLLDPGHDARAKQNDAESYDVSLWDVHQVREIRNPNDDN